MQAPCCGCGAQFHSVEVCLTTAAPTFIAVKLARSGRLVVKANFECEEGTLKSIDMRAVIVVGLCLELGPGCSLLFLQSQ